MAPYEIFTSPVASPCHASASRERLEELRCQKDSVPEAFGRVSSVKALTGLTRKKKKRRM